MEPPEVPPSTNLTNGHLEGQDVAITRRKGRPSKSEDTQKLLMAAEEITGRGLGKRVRKAVNYCMLNEGGDETVFNGESTTRRGVETESTARGGGETAGVKRKRGRPKRSEGSSQPVDEALNLISIQGKISSDNRPGNVNSEEAQVNSAKAQEDKCPKEVTSEKDNINSEEDEKSLYDRLNHSINIKQERHETDGENDSGDDYNPVKRRKVLPEENGTKAKRRYVKKKVDGKRKRGKKRAEVMAAEETVIGEGVENDKADGAEAPYDPYLLMNKLLAAGYAAHVERLIKEGEEQEKANESKISNTNICAICRKQFKTPSEWNRHKTQFHHNIAWKIGSEPLDYTNMSFLFYHFAKVLKQLKKFKCEICDLVKKSVAGYFSHVMICGKTIDEIEAVKVRCHLCDEPVMPTNLIAHDKWHKQHDGVAAEADDWTESTGTESLSSKRRAAQRASKLISDVISLDPDKNNKYYTSIPEIPIPHSAVYNEYIDTMGDTIICKLPRCGYESLTVDEAERHFNYCKEVERKLYICVKCSYRVTVKDEILHHLKSHRKIKEDDDDYSQGSETEEKCVDVEPAGKTEKRIRTDTLLYEYFKSYNLRFLNEFYPTKEVSVHIFRFTFVRYLKFCDDNFVKSQSTLELFKLGEKWRPLDKSVINDYIPTLRTSVPMQLQLTPQSCIGSTTIQNEQSYKLFEAKAHGPSGSSTIFCGGHVTSLAWAPTPYDNPDCDQILSVAVVRDIDKSYVISKLCNDKNILMFWNYGKLNNESQEVQVPELDSCLAHEHGAIFSMEWCPSGCYDDERYGVLAVTGTDGFVYGYSVWKGALLSGKLFRPKPIFKLSLMNVADYELCGKHSQPLRLSWSKSKGHNYIAVGYTNGVAAIYNLGATSKTLKDVDKQGTDVFYPILNFQAHVHAITGISLYHLNGGCRWLATASPDRYHKFWDLRNLGSPISLKKWNNIREMVWPTNWLCTIDCHDDIHVFTRPGPPQFTTLTHVRDFASTHNSTIMHMSRSLCCLSYSDWGNFVVTGNQTGELVGVYGKSMMPFLYGRGLNYKRFNVSYSAAVPLRDRKPKDVRKNFVQNYKTTSDDCKIIITDYKLHTYTSDIKVVPKKLLKDRTHENFEEYSISGINSVSINPNRYSYLYTATGYEAGFVRVYHIRFLAPEHR